jgi:hypothetical protein
MADVQASLDAAMAIDGGLGVALVDYKSGVCLGSKGGGGIDMELAGAAVTEVIRAKKNIIDNLGLDEAIEELIVTLDGQYHLVQAFEQHPGLFSYLILDKEHSSLPLARTHLRAIDRELVLNAGKEAETNEQQSDSVH